VLGAAELAPAPCCPGRGRVLGDIVGERVGDLVGDKNPPLHIGQEADLEPRTVARRLRGDDAPQFGQRGREVERAVGRLVQRGERALGLLGTAPRDQPRRAVGQKDPHTVAAACVQVRDVLAGALDDGLEHTRHVFAVTGRRRGIEDQHDVAALFGQQRERPVGGAERPREGKCEQRDGEHAQGEQKPVLHLRAAPGAPVRREHEAQRAERKGAVPPAVQQMDDQRHQRGERAEGEGRVLKSFEHGELQRLPSRARAIRRARYADNTTSRGDDVTRRTKSRPLAAAPRRSSAPWRSSSSR